MLTIQDIETRKKELEVVGIEKSKKTWHRVHKISEHLNNIFGGTGIVCGAVSSQLSGHANILLITGLTAAVSTALVAFLNLRSRSITFINAWRILDEATVDYLTDKNATLDKVGDAKNKAEKYIRDSLHKG